MHKWGKGKTYACGGRKIHKLMYVHTNKTKQKMKANEFSRISLHNSYIIKLFDSLIFFSVLQFPIYLLYDTHLSFKNVNKVLKRQLTSECVYAEEKRPTEIVLSCTMGEKEGPNFHYLLLLCCFLIFLINFEQ